MMHFGNGDKLNAEEAECLFALIGSMYQEQLLSGRSVIITRVE